jgi:FKBP-type peptidyl-prolyl cis-trans isomerase
MHLSFLASSHFGRYLLSVGLVASLSLSLNAGETVPAKAAVEEASTEAPAEAAPAQAIPAKTAPAVVPLNAGPDTSAWSLNKRASYIMGYIVSQQIQQQVRQGGFDAQTVLQGLTAGIRGEQPLIAQDTWNGIMNQYQQKAVEARNLASMKAKAEEEQYLADLKGKAGITFTESGLAYEVIFAAEGEQPKASDTVRVHYHGTLINGDVFDSSVQRNDPVEFRLNGVIAGWTEGVQLMQVGSKYRFHIPAALAYGEQGSSSIPGNSLLIFEVELLDIVK